MELRIDVADSEQMAKYEAALEYVRSTEMKEGKASEILKQQCQVIRKFIDICFKDGTAKELFGDKYNYKEHYMKLAELVSNANEDIEELNKMMISNASKYSAKRADRS